MTQNVLRPGEIKFAAYTVRLRRTTLQRWQGAAGPTGTLKCGKCFADWTQQIPITDYPRIPCPACKTINVLPIVPA